jgi:hypothetical protein
MMSKTDPVTASAASHRYVYLSVEISVRMPAAEAVVASPKARANAAPTIGFISHLPSVRRDDVPDLKLWLGAFQLGRDLEI